MALGCFCTKQTLGQGCRALLRAEGGRERLKSLFPQGPVRAPLRDRMMVPKGIVPPGWLLRPPPPALQSVPGTSFSGLLHLHPRLLEPILEITVTAPHQPLVGSSLTGRTQAGEMTTWPNPSSVAYRPCDRACFSFFIHRVGTTTTSHLGDELKVMIPLGGD